jgi:hypothetical protein
MEVPSPGEKYSEVTPALDERPFFCLLENDRLVTKVSIESDDLLQPLEGKTVIDPADCRLVITVRIKPYELTPANMHFG